MYRLAIFDFDGTLADSADWFVSTLNGAAERFGYRRIADDELDTLRGLSNREIIRRLGVRPWKMPAIARHFRAEAARSASAVQLFPGARDALAALAGRGIELAIVSSNGEDTVRARLGADAGLVSRYGCGVSLFGKARQLRRMVRACGISPAETIAVGDEPRDVEAARQAGVGAAAVTWGYATRPALAAASPDILFDSFAELVANLGSVSPAATPPNIAFGSPGRAVPAAPSAMLV